MEKAPNGLKLVPCRLVGVDGNAFALMATFKRDARKAGWTDDETKKVLDEAVTGDYDHLLKTLSSHCKNGGFGSDG